MSELPLVGELFGLQVFRAELLGPAPFSLKDLEGARRLRVLTYSASARLLARLSRRVEELEVVFGYEGALPPEDAFQRLLEVQFLVQEEIARSLRVAWEGEEAALLEKARRGGLRFLLSRRPSHAKLFLVEERDGRRWALLGSPNLSERALETGGLSQLELAFLLEGEEAFRHLEGCKLLPFLPSSISAVKLSHWARKHGMGYLTAWRSACGRCGKRLARDQAKRALESICG
jgi:phosphatidylserine/phosphatidylglycerophosphate/cardiolipin synthase-like enzyme